ncbi:AMP-binding protein [Aquabacterium sp.]|uniref:AMP-binding protein n=1 Tax=Aquabacterium sp. TaxID=1872578 RepID=UPI002BA6F90A|nr:AMP-binding protein [Aquabacterium sp.]HSW04732.1 AMP-binding protein [Aquabacterium sp.]
MPAELPFWQLERHAGRDAVTTADGRTLNYTELAAQADAAAADLQAGEVFALCCANTPDTLALYLGALRRQAVPLMLDSTLAPAQRGALLAAYGITRVFDGASGQWQRAPAPRAAPRAHPDLGLLLSTSGSTASPKLVRLARRNLAANAASIVQYLGLTADEVAITTLPMHYSYGLSIVNTHLGCGARLVLTEASVAQAEFWRLMREQQVSSLSGVPTLWRLLRRLRFERMSLPALRTLTQAGGRLEPEEIAWLADSARSAGRRVFIMYGQTEASARIAYLPPEQLAGKLGSIGLAIPGGRLRVLDAQGHEITEAGATGQLAYRGPNVMMGYAQAPEHLAQGAELDELLTGDLGHRDADGCFWVTGRLKRFIKVFGHRVSLDDVEQGLRAEGLDAGVVGRDDQLMVALPGATPEACAALQAALATRYRWLPAAVVVVSLPALPLASNGKLQYAELQALVDAQRVTPLAKDIAKNAPGSAPATAIASAPGDAGAADAR